MLHILKNIRVIEFKQGSVIYEEGDPADGSLYFILAGRVNVFKTVEGKSRQIDSLGEGQFFGASLFGRGDGEGSVHDDKVRLATLAHRRDITPCTMTASAPPPRSSPPFPDSGKFYSPFASRSRCFRTLLQAPAAKVAARLSRTQVCGAVRCRDGGGVRCGGLCWRCG